MPTIIDTLILEIGLDPSKFKKGQRDTTDATRKLKETAQKDLGAVEKSGNDAAASFELLGRRALSLFALFSGSAGLADFARRTIETNASTGKLAKTLDLTVKTLSTWRNVAVLTGGSVMAIQNSIVHLVSDFQTLALTGNSQTIPYFRALNIPVADAAGHMRKMDDILLDLADRFHHMDPARAAAWGRALGFDQDTINALIRGRDAVKALMDQARSLGTISDRDAASAIALQTAWGQVSIATQSAGRNMLTDLATFAKASSWLQDFFNFAISHTTGKGLGSLFDWIGRHDNLLGGTTPKLPTGGQAQRTSRSSSRRAGPAPKPPESSRTSAQSQAASQINRATTARPTVWHSGIKLAKKPSPSGRATPSGPRHGENSSPSSTTSCAMASERREQHWRKRRPQALLPALSRGFTSGRITPPPRPPAARLWLTRLGSVEVRPRQG